MISGPTGVNSSANISKQTHKLAVQKKSWKRIDFTNFLALGAQKHQPNPLQFGFSWVLTTLYGYYFDPKVIDFLADMGGIFVR